MYQINTIVYHAIHYRARNKKSHKQKSCKFLKRPVLMDLHNSFMHILTVCPYLYSLTCIETFSNCTCSNTKVSLEWV